MATAKPMLRRKKTKRVVEDEEELYQPEPDSTEPEGNADLDRILVRMAVLKDEAKAFNEANRAEFLALEEEVIKRMTKLGIRKYESTVATGTITQGHTEIIDWLAIERDLTKQEWMQVTERVGNKSKLESWLKANRSRAKEIAKHITQRGNKAYVTAVEK